MTAMSLCLMGNYAQTGHFGGPLAYTPYNVACHLAGPALGGLRYDLREPKFAYADKFMLAGGHCIPTCLRAVDHPVRGAAAAARSDGRRPFRVRSPKWRCCR